MKISSLYNSNNLLIQKSGRTVEFSPQNLEQKINRVDSLNYRANFIPFLGKPAPKKKSYDNEDDNIGSNTALLQYFKDVYNLDKSNNHKNFTDKEARELLQQARNGSEDAKNKLAEGYLRLVMKYARRYTEKGMELEDLIQEGNQYLLKAIDNFNLSRKDAKFTTYAAKYIESGIKKAIYRNSPIKYSEELVFLASKYLKAVDDYYDKSGTFPTKDEICAKLGIKNKDIVEIEEYLKSKPFSIHSDIKGITSKSGNKYTHEETIKDTRFDPEICLMSKDEVNTDSIPEYLREKLNLLSPRERNILILLYKLDGDGNVAREPIISEITGIPITTVPKKIQNTQNKLKIIMGEQPNTQPAFENDFFDYFEDINEFKDFLRKNLYRLSPPQKRVMEETYLTGKDIKKQVIVAEILGCDQAKISRDRIQAMQKLKEILMEPIEKKSYIGKVTDIEKFLELLVKNIDTLEPDEQKIMQLLYLDKKVRTYCEIADAMKLSQADIYNIELQSKQKLLNPLNKSTDDLINKETRIKNFREVLNKNSDYLSPIHRKVLMLRYLGGRVLTYQEIADKLDCHVSNAMYHTWFAIRELRETINDTSKQKPYIDKMTGIDNFLEKLKVNFDHLTPTQQNVMRIMYLEGNIKSQSEVANQLKCSRGTVDETYQNVKNKLRKEQNNDLHEVLKDNIECLPPIQQKIMKSLYLSNQPLTLQEVAEHLKYDMRFISVQETLAREALTEIHKDPSLSKPYLDKLTGIDNFLEKLKVNFNSLTPAQQNVMRVMCLEGEIKTQQEVAQILGCNNTNIFKELAMVKKIIENRQIDNFSDVLKTNIECLPPIQRKIMKLMYLDGQPRSQQEVANILNYGVKFISGQERLATETLKEIMKDPSQSKPYIDKVTGIDNFLEKLKVSFESLTPAQQNVMRVMCLEGEIKTQQEVAQILGCSKASVFKTFSKIIKESSKYGEI